MAVSSQLLHPVADKTVQWQLTGEPTHWQALASNNQASYVMALDDSIREQVEITTPIDQHLIGDLTQMQFTLRMLACFPPPPSTRIEQYIWLWRSDGVNMLNTVYAWPQFFGAQTQTVIAPITGFKGADTTAMWVEMRCYSDPAGPWNPGDGFLQQYQLICRLYYEEPTTTTKKDLEFPVADDKVMMQVSQTEHEMAVADAAVNIAVAPSAIEMAVADDEIVLQVDSEKEL